MQRRPSDTRAIAATAADAAAAAAAAGGAAAIGQHAALQQPGTVADDYNQRRLHRAGELHSPPLQGLRPVV